ncbi:MAG: hypothetical protein ABI895_32715 [Deltaproteobacteria bacterium]
MFEPQMGIESVLGGGTSTAAPADSPLAPAADERPPPAQRTNEPEVSGRVTRSPVVCPSTLIQCIHGSCSESGSCVCIDGYTDPTCSTDIDDCAAQACYSGGRCSDRIAGYVCDCTGLAYAGPQCRFERFRGLPISSGLTLFPAAVSGDGRVVVGTTSSGEDSIGSFRWTITDELALYSDLGTGVRGLSQDGAVLLGVDSGTTDVSFVWRDTSGRVTLPAPDGLPSCVASDLDRDGSHVTGTCYDAERTAWNAVRWVVRDGMARVDVLPNSLGGTQSNGYAINADGTRISGSSFAAGGHAMLWTLSETALPFGEDLGLLPNAGVYPTARALSEDGLSVAGDDGSNAFTWTQIQGIRLLPQPVPADASASGFAIDMDAAGSVVVGGLLPSAGGTAFETLVWDANGAHRLRQLLVDAGVVASAIEGWQLSNPSAISADGLSVVGVGISPSGEQRGWIAHLR